MNDQSPTGGSILMNKPHLAPRDSEAAKQALSEKVSVRDVSFFYGEAKALKNISLPIYERKVTALIGPSGCGKSTLLRIFNRMYDLYPKQRAEGEILFDGGNVLDPKQDLNLLRARIGMVFQKPTPFPMSIYDNIAFGIRLYERLPKSEMDDRVESALKRAALWDEVKAKLGQSGLLDEPTSALDPIATAKVEELIYQLKNDYTIVIVTHNMQQAARVADYTAFMYLGELVEFGETRQVFTKPTKSRTEDYITGRFG